MRVSYEDAAINWADCQQENTDKYNASDFCHFFFASFFAQQYMCRVSLGLEWNTAALAIAKALYIPADK